MGFDTADAGNAVSSLFQYPMETVDVGPEVVLDAYEISSQKNHDVYDCLYVSLAGHAEADVLLTTDTDFERLCADEPFEYTNPVPDEVLSRFHSVST